MLDRQRLDYDEMTARLEAHGVPMAPLIYRGPFDADLTARCGAWAGHYSGRWATTTVRAMLVNPAYAGDLVWNRRTDARFHRIASGVAVERHAAPGRRLEPNAEARWGQAQAEQVRDQTVEFMRGLASALREGPLAERQAAMRRCVSRWTWTARGSDSISRSAPDRWSLAGLEHLCARPHQLPHLRRLRRPAVSICCYKPRG